MNLLHNTSTFSTAQLRASVQLPNEDALDRAAIRLDLATAWLVYCVLSRVIAAGTSKQRGLPYHLMKGLADVCKQDVMHFGELLAAPHPELSADGWPSGTTALKHLGITGAEITATWRAVKNRADDAVLPLDWVLEFVPAAIWQAVSTFISWGPDAARIRMEEAVVSMAAQTTTYDRRRRKAGSPIARNTIEPRISAVWKLMAILVEFRTQLAAAPRRSLDLALIDLWTHKPPRVNARACGALDSGQDNSGPAIDDCSRRIKELYRAWQETPNGARYMRHRRLVCQALLCLYGARADALRNARVEDFLPHAWPDGTRGPALRIFPAKTWHPSEAHYLPLPDEVAEWLIGWITLNGFVIGEPNRPLLPTTKPKPGQAPQPLSQPAFYQAIAGQRRGPSRGSHALMPRDGDPYRGWHPHAYRRASYQLAVRAGIQFKLDHPTELAHVRPEEFAAAIAGHKLDDSVSATYRSLDRQQLTRAVVPAMWAILWGDGTQRKGLDVVRVRRAREHRDLAQLALRALEEDVRGLQIEADRLAARVQASGAPTQAQLMSALLATQQVAAKRDHRDQAKAALNAAEAEFRAALETTVALPDDLDEDEYEALLADALGAPQDTTAADDERILAATITVEDAAELFDVTPQAIRRWIRDGFPRHRPTAWLQDAWITRTQKDRRLRVDLINQAALTQTQRERLLDLRRRRADLDAQYFHPGRKVRSNHGSEIKEKDMNEGQTTGRQTADGLVDAWQTTGTSPPNEAVSNDDEEGAS
jgi:hypothetical protein